MPVSPARDYTKVANSIHREAVPAGFFAGKSKQLYDCLYSLTRGAVVPSRTVRISRPKLMKKSGIGARVTFDANIERLVAVGLIRVQSIAGEHEGNEYTVFLPEEVSAPSMPSQTSLTRYAQKLDRLVCLETSQTRHTLNVENKETSDTPKTSFKTYEENDDDEAFADFAAVFRQAAREITGRELIAAERHRLKELADLLVTELRIAAGRTTVSSVPAFLAEHLRRRLWKRDKRELEAEAAAGGKNASEGQQTRRAAIPGDCPDCFGTGMYYPEGFDKGVARCEHKRLAEPPGPAG